MFQRLLPTILFSSIVLTGIFSQQTVLATLMHDSLERDYRLFIPSGYSADMPMPLLYSFDPFVV